jgi:hypothetical protein
MFPPTYNWGNLQDRKGKAFLKSGFGRGMKPDREE